jgi:hypothetical protein
MRIAGFTFGLCIWGALAVLPIGPAHADDREPPPNVARCDSIQQLEEEYPDSHFTKLSPAETTAMLNAAPDPSNEMVVFYSVPFPKDPSVTVVHAYSANGCWLGAVQLPADKFEQIIHGDTL